MDQKTEAEVRVETVEEQQTNRMLKKFGIEIAEEDLDPLQVLLAEATQIQTLVKLRSTLTYATGGDTIKKAERALNQEINSRVQLLAAAISQRLKKSDDERKA